jgi:hypothetical protein
MQYALPLAREEFDLADRVVRAVIGRPERQLRTITSDIRHLEPADKVYVEKSSIPLGVCFIGADIFDVWVSSAFQDPSTEFYLDTVLHELCHGYLANGTHTYPWRRVLGRVVHHYSKLVRPIDHDDMLETMLYRYTSKAKKETQADYDLRLQEAHDSIAELVMDEWDAVAYRFNRLNTQETSA